MENQNQEGIRYDIYIDSIKDETSKKEIIMFLAGVVKHIQLEDIIAGISNLPFKVVNAVTEQTAMKLQERLGLRGAVVRMVQLVPGSAPAAGEPAVSEEPVFRTQEQPSPDTQTVSAGVPPQFAVPATPPLEQKLPGSVSSLKRLWLNWVDVMFNTASFFKSIADENQVPFPVIFAVLWGTVAIVLNMPSVAATQRLYLNFFTGSMSAPAVLPVSLYASTLVMAPFFLFVFLFIMAGIYHISVLLLGGKGGFVSTLKVVCYSTGAMVLEVIPYVGVPLFWFYSLYLYTIGFRELHKISTSRSFVAAILPVALLFAFIVLVMALVIIGFGVNFLKEFRPQIPGMPV